jgi:hypothetical protein
LSAIDIYKGLLQKKVKAEYLVLLRIFPESTLKLEGRGDVEGSGVGKSELEELEPPTR